MEKSISPPLDNKQNCVNTAGDYDKNPMADKPDTAMMLKMLFPVTFPTAMMKQMQQIDENY
jgi:hypothetical protein